MISQIIRCWQARESAQLSRHRQPFDVMPLRMSQIIRCWQARESAQLSRHSQPFDDMPLRMSQIIRCWQARESAQRWETRASDLQQRYACDVIIMCKSQILRCWQARESAQRWETRASDLQQRYGKVDLKEHQRVQAELEAMRTQLQQLNSQADEVVHSVQ